MADPEVARAEYESLAFNVKQLQRVVSDHAQRFDTLQSPLWKRVWFRLDGWPGQRNLNAERPVWRPWHRWTRG
jgi:hypothetical protein